MQTKFSKINPLALDKFEKYVLCAIFLFFTYRMVLGYLDSGSPITLIYLFDQFIILGFILVRRATSDISTNPVDWFAGFAGTFLALLFGAPSGEPIVPVTIVLLLMFGGLLVHLSAKIILRRSFGVVAANRGVKASGPYRLVRHPMYTGYMFSQTGLLLAGPTLNNIIILVLCWGIFVWRIIAEERILGKDPSYYANLPRFKLVPGVY